MANPNIVSLTTLTYDNAFGALTTTTATIIPSPSTGTVLVIEEAALIGIVTGAFTATVSKNSTEIYSSIQVTGFTTQELSTPIVIKETQCLTGKASANVSVNYDFNFRVLG